MFSGDPTHRVISLGGGVQSTAMTYMASLGMFGSVPDLAVFADTGWESPEVYETVDWLSRNVSFPVMTSQKSDLAKDLMTGRNAQGQTGYAPIPAFFRKEGSVKVGMKHRQCTSQYKIRAVRQGVRDFLGLGWNAKATGRGYKIEQWLGISTDEADRCRASDESWVRLRYPLVEFDLSRSDCRTWWDRNAPSDAPELVRSSCLGCPYKSSQEWAELAKFPDRLEETAKIERLIQSHDPMEGRTLFLHRRGIPLKEAIAADIAEASDSGSLLSEECQGYCGV